MRTTDKPPFLRYLVGGFALGTICLIGSQVVAHAQPPVPAPMITQAAAR
ncbi:hypothetical protein [Sphingomonas sp.]|nr:hypothetical protein [Sphingomonas sp.]